MRLRLSEPPWGLARFTFAYLAGLLAMVVAAIVAGVAYAVLSTPAVLGGVGRIYALLLAMVVVLLVGWVIGLALTGFIFRLGWLWAAAGAVWTVLTLQLVVLTSWYPLLWLIALAPAVAAAVTFERPDRPPRPRVVLGRVVILAVLALEFVVWLVVWLLTA